MLAAIEDVAPVAVDEGPAFVGDALEGEVVQAGAGVGLPEGFREAVGWGGWVGREEDRSVLRLVTSTPCV